MFVRNLTTFSILAVVLLIAGVGCTQGGPSGASSDSATDALKEKGVTFSRDLKNKIQAVRFGTHQPSDDEFLTVASFEDLKEIHGDIPAVSEKGLAAIGALKKLQVVCLSGATVSAQNFSSICSLTSLQQLDLKKSTGIDDAAVASLKSHPTLQSLDLGFTDITDASLDTILSMPKLKSIRLIGTRLTDKGLGRLASTATLEEIAVGSDTITNEGVKLLASAEGLLQLEIVGSKVTDEAMVSICGLPKLKSLLLTDNAALTDSGICQLGKLPLLTNISVAGTAFTGSGISKAGFPQLLGLDANRTQVTDANIGEFSAIVYLTSLKLKGTQVTEKAVRAVFPINDPTSVALGPAEN